MGGWVEEKKAVRMSYCDGWVGGWVGGRRTSLTTLYSKGLGGVCLRISTTASSNPPLGPRSRSLIQCPSMASWRRGMPSV